MMIKREVFRCQIQCVIPDNRVIQASYTCSRIAFLGGSSEKNIPNVNVCRLLVSYIGRTRLESDRHGGHDGADRGPDFHREFRLSRVGIARYRCQEDDILGSYTLQSFKVELCDRKDVL
jgi:hypothetical protein